MSQWHIDPTPYSLMVLALGLIGLGFTFVAQSQVLGVVFLAAAGLAITYHLYHEKRESMNDMTCPIGQDCVKVVSSKYSRFLGVSVEILGGFYYGFILLTYGLIFIMSGAIPSWLLFIALAASTFAVLFSGYLTYIQAVPLGWMWCVWCVTSAIISTFILIASLLRIGDGIVPLLSMYEPISFTIYLLSIAVGLGTAVATDVLFINFSRDFEISKAQANAITTLYQVTWAALAFIVVAGLGYFIPHYQDLMQSAGFRVSMVTLAVILLNELLLHFNVGERMKKLRFVVKEEEREQDELQRKRQLTFILTTVSAVSWAAMFVSAFAEALFEIPFTFTEMVTAYLVIVLLAAFLGLLVEKILSLRAVGRLEDYLPFDLMGETAH
ncbi:MAG: vitamin K epoxide reductase family protein [Candidatus Nanohaloarchaeota archaeon QJJ-5]|nr:vitamin K epoxide reductase family protein [Candidatus Nanohaloarchaeota archaeon QJJ-5]